MTSPGGISTPHLYLLAVLLPTLGVAIYLAVQHFLIWFVDRTDDVAFTTSVWALTSSAFVGTRLAQKLYLDPAVALFSIRVSMLTLGALVYTAVRMVRAVSGTPLPQPWGRWFKLYLVVSIVIAEWFSWFAAPALRLREDRSGVVFYGIDRPWFFVFVMLGGVFAAFLIRRILQRSTTMTPTEKRLLRFALITTALLGINDFLQVLNVYRFFMTAELMPMPIAFAMSMIVASRQRHLRAQLEERVAARTAELNASNVTLQDALDEMSASEANLRLLLDASPDAIVVVQNARVRHLNQAARQQLGEVLDVEAATISPDLDPERQPTASDHPQRIEYRRSDGSHAQAEGLWRRFVFEHTPAVLWIIRDISDRVHLEESLQKAERLAALGTLAANVAHEVNNPLSYVHGNLSLLRSELAILPSNEPLGDAQRHELDTMIHDAIDGATRVRDIVRELRAFGRKSSDEMTGVDLRVVIDKVEKLTRAELRPRARLLIDVAGHTYVKGNEMRLVQILVNLVINGAHAITSGAPHQNHVTIRVIDGSGDRIVVEVQDSGCGIEEKLASRIFEPFFSTKTAEGTGLGLSITRELVRQLGGSISVKSVVDQGSTFRVVLQRALEVPTPIVDDATDRVLIDDMRILVIESEPFILRAIERILRGHRLDIADCAETALPLLSGDPRSRHRYDAILCDVILPGMPGTELYRRVIVDEPTLAARFVFMTGVSPGDAMLTTLPIANPVLFKPFDEAALRNCLSTLQDIRTDPTIAGLEAAAQP